MQVRLREGGALGGCGHFVGVGYTPSKGRVGSMADVCAAFLVQVFCSSSAVCSMNT